MVHINNVGNPTIGTYVAGTTSVTAGVTLKTISAVSSTDSPGTNGPWGFGRFPPR